MSFWGPGANLPIYLIFILFRTAPAGPVHPEWRIPMPTDAQIQAMMDEHEIAGVVIGWGFARDSGDWEALAACYHEGATMRIMWTAGPAAEFVERLRARPPQKPGEHTKHLIGVPGIRLNGDRAVSECHITLFSRVILDGHEFDFTAWIRFFDLFEKREGAWRILRRTAIYEKDRMDPAVPGAVPESYFAGMGLEGYPPECKFMCFRHAKQGREMEPDIVGGGSEAERALKKEGEAWLKNFSDSLDPSGWPVAGEE